jgi:hypothetical protein
MEFRPRSLAPRDSTEDAARPPTITSTLLPSPKPVANSPAISPGRAGASTVFARRRPSEPTLSIFPGPQPLPLAANKPGWLGTTPIGNGLLVPSDVSTLREPCPKGADEGIQASIRLGSTEIKDSRMGRASCSRITRTSLDARPNRTPSIMNLAPRAIDAPANVEGVRLAELTTPF